MIKKKDIILFISLLTLAGIGFLLLAFMRGDGEGHWDAVIEKNGTVIARLPLSEDTEYIVSDADGQNVIRILNGAVSVMEADCKNQICVFHGELTPENADTDFISCAPHHLIIYLERSKGGSQ